MRRNWLTEIRLDCDEIFIVHVNENSILPEVTQRLHAAIQSHSDLFEDELGTVRGISAKLEIKEGTSRKSFKARTVPYERQESVEGE